MPTDEITIEDLVNWYCEEQGIEIWKPVEGFRPNYSVSNTGKIKNTNTGTIIKPMLNRFGYQEVLLYRTNGTRIRTSVARLVAKAWVPNPLNHKEVNHIDEVKTSNNAANLEWCDRCYNMNWGTCKERAVAKIVKPVVQMALDGSFIAEYESASEASRQTGVNRVSISYALRGVDSMGRKFTTAGGYRWCLKSK